MEILQESLRLLETGGQDAVENLTIHDINRQIHLQEWAVRISDCRSSGKAVKTWCAENDIPLKTYYKWQRIVFRALLEQQNSGEQQPATSSNFVQLPYPTESSGTNSKGPCATVHVGCCSIDFYEGISSEMILKLCRVLNNAE